MVSVDNTPPLTPPASSDGGLVEPKPWVHDPSRPYFLPPGSSQPASIALINDSLEIVREYREFVDTVGKLEAEYGRALAAAARKLETKLDAVVLPVPGARKPPEPTVVKALRAHLVETNTVASLHSKHPGALNDQLIRPLTHLERRIGETSRRLGSWGKDIRTRWDAGRERVETARAKYHASVRDHDAAVTRFRACPAPNGAGKSDAEWVKLERAAAEAEASRADRKRAYIVALAGEGLDGGCGRDLIEGGGDWGWGEESRALYGHVEYTLLELLKHHAFEDKAHNRLLGHVFERAEKCYDAVSIAADQNAFLEWNITDRSAPSPSRSSSMHEQGPSPLGSPQEVNDSTLSSPSRNRASLTVLTPISPAHPSLRSERQPSSSPDYPTLSCLTFVAPSGARDETPALGTDKRADRDWLVNRWLQSQAVLKEVEGLDGLGGTLGRQRQDLEALRDMCVTYAKNRGHGDAEAVWEKRITLQRSIGEDERRAAVAKAESSCLEAVLGPNPAPELTHDFKDKLFATPSPCAACGTGVWSPLKAELSCRGCGVAVHNKCALHVDPECTGLKSSRRKSSHSGIRRSITTRLRRQSMFESPHGAPQEYRPNPTTIEPLREEEIQVSPFVTTTSEIDRPAIVEALTTTTPKPPVVSIARVVYDYSARDEYQLHIWAGEILRVLEPDLSGNGWVRVRRGLQTGEEGLVPQTCLDLVGKNSPSTSDGGSGTFVVGAFDFPPPHHSLGVGQACIRKHQLYELSDEGHNFDPDWTELVVPDGTGVRLRGIVPKNYVKAI